MHLILQLNDIFYCLILMKHNCNDVSVFCSRRFSHSIRSVYLKIKLPMNVKPNEPWSLMMASLVIICKDICIWDKWTFNYLLHIYNVLKLVVENAGNLITFTDTAISDRATYICAICKICSLNSLADGNKGTAHATWTQNRAGKVDSVLIRTLYFLNPFTKDRLVSSEWSSRRSEYQIWIVIINK